jgi:hypothetical protein
MSLTCITPAIWCTSRTLRGSTDDRAIYLTGAPAPTRLKRDGRAPVYLSATQGYSLVPDSRFAPGEWKASTRGYVYTVFVEENRQPVQAVGWHWHPGSGKSDEPHMHIYRPGDMAGEPLNRLHFPAERVAFESVVKFLIDELGVEPLRDDWREHIDAALKRFVAFRTWPKSGGPLPDSN